MLQIPLENGQVAVNTGLKLQGQAKGFDMCIDLIFEIANYVEQPVEKSS